MAHSIEWDGQFVISPVPTDKVGDTPTFIQETRAGVEERIKQEHSFNHADTLNDNQGKHLPGSARALVSDSEPADPELLTDSGEFLTGRFRYAPTTRKLYIYKDAVDEWVDAVLDENGSLAVEQLESTIATGTAPLVVASTTVVSNLNVDQLDGYDAGNASGDVPVSNGTVNVNLNADQLDGYHGSSSATASTVIVRDSAGRAKVVAPSADNDIAIKSDVKVSANDRYTGTSNITLSSVALGETRMRAFRMEGLTTGTTRTVSLPASGTYTYLTCVVASSPSVASDASAAGGTVVASITVPEESTGALVGFCIYTRIA